MKKHGLLLIVVSSVLLVGCSDLGSFGDFGGTSKSSKSPAAKEINAEAATLVAQDITRKLSAEDYKAPTKLTAEMETVVKLDSQTTNTMKLNYVIDEGAEYYYMSEDARSSSENEFVTYWSYKEGSKYISAAIINLDGTNQKQYIETDEPYTIPKNYDYDISTFINMTIELADSLSSMSDETLIEETASYTFKSSGSGSLILNATGKEAGQIGSIVIENYLLTSYESLEADRSTKIKLNWGVAKLNKPNLSDFEKVEME